MVLQVIQSGVSYCSMEDIQFQTRFCNMKGHTATVPRGFIRQHIYLLHHTTKKKLASEIISHIPTHKPNVSSLQRTNFVQFFLINLCLSTKTPKMNLQKYCWTYNTQCNIIYLSWETPVINSSVSTQHSAVARLQDY